MSHEYTKKSSDGVYTYDRRDILFTDDIFDNPVEKSTISDLKTFFDSKINVDSLKAKHNIWRKSPEEDIPVKDIVPTQYWVNKKIMDKYIDGKKKQDVLVLKAGEKYILYDGHHRTSCDIIQGKKKIKAKVIQAPDNLFKHYRE
jgi:hypothetical protein